MDNTLQNTLTGTLQPLTATTVEPPKLPPTPAGLMVPTTVGTPESISQDIAVLQAAQQQPSSLVTFQKAMALSSQLAYKDRQAIELDGSSRQFDPMKVSGGTFASIISNLEQNRGADVGKIYASTMSAYASAQEQITNRLQFLEQLKESRDQFNKEFDLRKKQIKQQMKLDKQGAKLAKKKLEQDQSNWEREFALATSKARSTASSNGVYNNLGEIKALYDSLKNMNVGGKTYGSSGVNINRSTPGLNFSIDAYNNE